MLYTLLTADNMRRTMGIITGLILTASRRPAYAFPLTSPAIGRSRLFGSAPLKSTAPSSSSSSSSRLFHATSSVSNQSKQSQYGVGMDQNAMMESDLLVIVDENDQLLFEKGTTKDDDDQKQDGMVHSSPTISKKLAHSFHPRQPRGICHRAFSLFVFDENANLLLTQRASSKITFPGVWTNTCCSHPLYGMTPNEVDDDNLEYPSFNGIKHAAIRKAQHELGLTSLTHADMTFVSRFHYWAADVRTHGPMSPWGEHEVDYILFCQLPQRPTLDLDPDEVAAIRYVSRSELQEMMDKSTEEGYQWSPWFLGMMERGVMTWWEDLEATLRGQNTNRDITFFDPNPDFVADYNLDMHTRTTGVGLPETESDSTVNGR